MIQRTVDLAPEEAVVEGVVACAATRTSAANYEVELIETYLDAIVAVRVRKQVLVEGVVGEEVDVAVIAVMTAANQWTGCGCSHMNCRYFAAESRSYVAKNNC